MYVYRPIWFVNKKKTKEKKNEKSEVLLQCIFHILSLTKGKVKKKPVMHYQ